jgi:hypothetical protein
MIGVSHLEAFQPECVSCRATPVQLHLLVIASGKFGPYCKTCGEAALLQRRHYEYEIEKEMDAQA